MRHRNRRLLKIIGSWGLCCAVVLATAQAGFAQEKTPLPLYKPGQSVYVSGVPDRYQDLVGQIERLERSSPQTYYVVVIKSAGPGATATRDYVTALDDAWRAQRRSGAKGFDPNRSVIIVAALENRQVAMHTGEVLRDRWNLRGETIDQDLVRPAFIPLATGEKYPEALASLLNATNDWIAERDPNTSKAASVTAPAPTPNPAAHSPASTLFMGSIVAAAVILATIFGLIWLARRRVKNRVDARIKELKASSVDIMDRLDALKERLKLLPSSDPDFKTPMTGETLALYEDIRERVKTLWDRWLQIMDAIEKAQKLVGVSVNPLGKKALEDAENQLEQKGVLEDIDRLSQACTGDLDRLEQSHESARAIVAEITKARPKLDSALSAVSALGLPVKPYEQERESLTSAATAAETAITSDPIGTATTLQGIRTGAETLNARVERIAALHGEARQVGSWIATLRKQVDGYRSGGLRLTEDGGNPDPSLAQAAEAHESALASLRDGDPDATAGQLEAAKAAVQAAKTLVESVQKSKAACERERTNRARETQRLREAMSQAESYQRELERDFAPDSWRPVIRNLEQAKALLATFDRRVEEASELASTSRQEYLAGARSYEQLAQQQQIVLRLMSGLGEQLNALIAVRADSRKVGQDLSAARKQLEIQIQQHGSIVGNPARRALVAMEATIDQATAQFADPHPDWPSIRRALADAAGELSEVRAQVESDIRDYDALNRDYEAVRQKADRVYTLLATHQADRVAANRLYRTAAAQLDEIGQELAALDRPASALLERVRGVDADLDQAEQLAHQDIELAEQAEAVIGEATRTIRQVSANGLMTNTSEAESRLVQAEQLHQSQSYEQAIEAAASALEAARWSHQQAMQIAMSQQAAMEADQRRLAYRTGPSWGGISAGSVAAATAAAVLLERMGSNAANAAPPVSSAIPEPIEPAPDPDSSDASLSSWSNDSSQSQW